MPSLAETAQSLPEPAPAAYTELDSYYAALDRKGTAHPGYGLYPRDGSAEVTDVERAISQITIPGQHRNVVVGSGMAAVYGALTFGLRHQYEPGAQRQPLVASAEELYSQSLEIANADLPSYGSRKRKFNSGDDEEIDRLFEGELPDVIFLETVGNSATIPVHNVLRLLQNQRDVEGKKPLIVWDNTLPLSTGINFDDFLDPEDEVLVVESLTKGGMHNSGHLGVVYSANEELMDEFRRHKARLGIVTSTGIDGLILETIQASTETYDERNLALFASAGHIATELAGAVEIAKATLEKPDPGFFIPKPVSKTAHPNISTQQTPVENAGSPVTWISDTSWDETKTRRVFETIVAHREVKEQIDEGQLFLGQSFGFEHARLLYDPGATQIRVAGGYGIENEPLARALRNAVLDAYIGE
jgi:cystathionine beta-lyase/cystathionine gamma-synthase